MQPAIHDLLVVAVLATASLMLVDATYYCQAPPSVENGGHSGANRHYFQESSVITYWCDDGYSLQGASQITCSYSRSTRKYQWDGAAPSCTSNHHHTDNGHNDDDDDDGSEESSSIGRGTTYCSSLSSISNGYVTYHSKKPGSIARYSCRSGYALDGNAYRKCLSSGYWSGSEPECKTDRHHTDNDHDDDDDDKEASEDSSTSGRSTSEDSSKDSSTSGQGTTYCHRPERPDNGWVKYRYTSVGAQAWYYCNQGYTRVGVESRTCTPSRKWEPELPTCKRSGCEKLVSPHYGIVIYSSTTVGSYAKYFCKDGYYLVGIRFRKCEETGWTDEAPICKPILCDHLPSLKYGRIRLSYGYRWNSIATHSCNWGYQLKKDHGDVKRVCQDDGSWSGSPPLCIPIDCGPLPAPDDGSVRVTSTRVGAIAKYACNNGFTLNGWNKRTCQNSGMWSGDAPTCKRHNHSYSK